MLPCSNPKPVLVQGRAGSHMLNRAIVLLTGVSKLTVAREGG